MALDVEEKLQARGDRGETALGRCFAQPRNDVSGSDPFWVLHAVEALEQEDAFKLWPDQYRWAIVRRAELGQYERK